jgi:arylsulfatase A
LFADDLGWTGLGCFGSDLYETPNLDALAASGVKFTNAYSACTVCSPTRASLMTGMYPAKLHLTDFLTGQNRPFAKMKIPDWTKKLDSRYVTIAEALKGAGYRTAHIGKWHLSGKGENRNGTMPTDQGFDLSYDGPPRKGYFLKEGDRSAAGTNYLTDILTDKACEFIDQSQDDPFFLYFAYHVPHTPIQGRSDLVDYFQTKVKNASANKKLTHDNPTYAAMVKSMDESVGRILKTLKQHKLTDKTIVIFTSDNGGLTQRYGKHDRFTENLPLRRGKGSAFEGGVRVPMITHWPGHQIAGQVCDTPVMSIDIYPTLLELAGASGDEAHNKSIDGVSIASLIKGENAEIERDLFWHYPHYHAGGDGPYSAIRSGNFRLIEFHEDKSLRLYDLAKDIGEQNDLSKKMPDKTNSLMKRLNDWRQSVGAQMPTVNPNFDAGKATKVEKANL